MSDARDSTHESSDDVLLRDVRQHFTGGAGAAPDFPTMLARAESASVQESRVGIAGVSRWSLSLGMAAAVLLSLILVAPDRAEQTVSEDLVAQLLAQSSWHSPSDQLLSLAPVDDLAASQPVLIRQTRNVYREPARLIWPSTQLEFDKQ